MENEKTTFAEKTFALLAVLLIVWFLASSCQEWNEEVSTGGSGGSETSDCESRVDGMQADGITPESDRDYYVGLCEEMD